MRFNRVASGVLAGTLLLTGVSSAFAASGLLARTHPAVAVGQVSNLSTSGFTLTRLNKKTNASVVVNVTVSATTRERALKGTAGALANGEYAAAVGVKSSDGSITATRVVYSSKPLPVRRAVQRVRNHLLRAVGGTVATSSASSISVTTKKGKTYTFNITAQTKFRVSGKAVTTAPSFTQGEHVFVVFRGATALAAATPVDAVAIIVPKS